MATFGRRNDDFGAPVAARSKARGGISPQPLSVNTLKNRQLCIAPTARALGLGKAHIFAPDVFRQVQTRRFGPRSNKKIIGKTIKIL